MEKFNYASLFSGVGGFEMALNSLGGRCVFSSEIDKFAAQAYETLYGYKPAGDITKIEAKDVPDHDLLVGGFPCQAFSVAGKRKGLEDARGTLFFDIARIASEKHPSALLLENVKGLVNHDKGNTLDLMVETLNDIGYVIDFDVLNSKYFGVPQNRERIFIVAIRKDLIESEPFNEEATTGQTIVPKGKRRISEWAQTFNFDWPEQAEVTTRLRDILESEVDEKYYLDEENTAKLVTQLEERHHEEVGEDSSIIQQAQSGVRLRKESGTLRSCLNHQHVVESQGKGIKNCDSALRNYKEFYDKNGYIPEFFNPYNQAEIDKTAPTVTAQCTRINNSSTVLKIEENPQMLGHVDIKGNDSIKRTYSTEGISPTLTSMGGGHREPKIAEEQLLDAEEWAIEQRIRNGEQGLPIREATKKGYAIAEEGDSVNVQFPGSKQIANTLEASSINQGVVESPPKYRIRKLTPLECWRLQGFPDEAHDAVMSAGISDSQRYKQAGNAVTVSVIEAIGERLIPLISP